MKLQTSICSFKRTVKHKNVAVIVIVNETRNPSILKRSSKGSNRLQYMINTCEKTDNNNECSTIHYCYPLILPFSLSIANGEKGKL